MHHSILFEPHAIISTLPFSWTYCFHISGLAIVGKEYRDSQVKKGELTGATAMLVDKSTGQITAKYRAKIVVGNLYCLAQSLIQSRGRLLHVR